ncbi:MAG: iron-sulfur cluster assembly scaffold protein [Parvibaculum sp.]|uniref:iron-sulfur cluster assembly scaffold protein n=1 Tax=Parvibaculum sp. TaxID=2024848 RepID=UPI0025FEEB45|nr:iron-sulfur cluster assembly scaffold protein [Parvibaculum sp.]MCE9649506.1 iron-sulfur cluster assembly scaffold protein [Parvibaculum sp.]
MLNEIYNTRILKLAADIPLTERLAEPDATVTAVSKLCGSKVTVDVKMDGDKVVGYGADIKACALGQASSSIMARHVIGATAAELHEVGREMRRMLKEGGEPPRDILGGKWADLEVLEPVRDYKARHASTLLVFDAVEEAVDEAMAKAQAGAQGSGTPRTPETATSTGSA